jgi:hypothetical protein
MARASWLHVYAAVAYADIFSYPLTREEIVRWGRWPKARLIDRIRLPAALQRKQQWYMIRGKSAHIARRARRFFYSKQKWRIARQVSQWLRWIPTIELVGVTGGLAMNNADRRDDIDIYIVTTPGFLWISRLLAVGIISLVGRRRTPATIRFGDTICMNMFVSRQMLAIPQKERDLFAAHEVLQMAPLWDRNGTYTAFLKKNSWVKRFLPNAWAEKMKNEKLKMKNYSKSNFTFYILHFTLLLCEPFARFIQIWYMRHRRTSEVITDDVLRFHPHDARVWVKEALAKRLKRVDIPLDKIFYAR